MSKEEKSKIVKKPANVFNNMVDNTKLVKKSLTNNPEDNNSKEEIFDPEEMKNFSVRMPVGYKDLLTKYFNKKGVNMSNGLREVIYTYMRDQGLIK